VLALKPGQASAEKEAKSTGQARQAMGRAKELVAQGDREGAERLMDEQVHHTTTLQYSTTVQYSTAQYSTVQSHGVHGEGQGAGNAGGQGGGREAHGRAGTPHLYLTLQY